MDRVAASSATQQPHLHPHQTPQGREDVNNTGQVFLSSRSTIAVLVVSIADGPDGDAA